jgi:hypothetical protein
VQHGRGFARRTFLEILELGHRGRVVLDQHPKAFYVRAIVRQTDVLDWAVGA